MFPLDPLLIQSFPPPPTHIPHTPSHFNPPPSLPPSAPLPPIPGPSRILGQESFFLSSSSATTRSRRVSKFSIASIDGIVGWPSPVTFPHHSPLHRHPTEYSIKEGRNRDSGPPDGDEEDALLKVNVDLNVGMSDVDVDADVMPNPMARPFRTRRRKEHHQVNESISSIDMRDIFSAAGGASEDEDEQVSAQDVLLPALPLPLPISKTNHISLSSPIDPPTLSSQPNVSPATSSPYSPNLPCSPPSPDIPSIISSTPRPPANPHVSSISSSVPSKKGQSLQRRASEGLRSNGKSKSKPRTSEPAVQMPRSMSAGHYFIDRRSWIDLDELGRPIPIPMSGSPILTGDISSVGTDEADNHNRWSWSNLYPPWGEEVEDDAGEGSDSSIDLHTPLPHLMLKHGLLSPHSKLLSRPQPLPIGRASVVSLASTTSAKTNSAPLKDSRDTAHRRSRHRDGRLLRGGIGLTTGLGWSDSEDEDAPSALTRRLSKLNLTRRSSSSSFSPSFSQIPSPTNQSIQPPSHLITSSQSYVPPLHEQSLTRSYSSRTLDEDRENGIQSLFRGGARDEMDEWGVTESTGLSTIRGSQTLPNLSLRKSASASSRSNFRASSNSKARLRAGPNTSTPAVSPTSIGIGGRIPEDHGENDNVPMRLTTRRIGVTSSSMHSASNNMSSPSTASSHSVPLPVTPFDYEGLILPPQNLIIPNTTSRTTPPSGGTALPGEKTLPPLPPSLRRISGSSNLSSMNTVGRGITFPRGTSASVGMADAINTVEGHLYEKDMSADIRPSTISLRVSPLITRRPLRLTSLPHLTTSARSQNQDKEKNRTSIPAPSISTSSSTLSPLHQLRSLTTSMNSSSIPTTPSPVDPFPPLTPSGPSASMTGMMSAAMDQPKPKPRTGTGMVYRSSNIGGPSRLRLPSSSSLSVLGLATKANTGGATHGRPLAPL